MIDKGIRTRIKEDPIFALNVFRTKAKLPFLTEEDSYLRSFALSKLVSIHIINLNYVRYFGLVDFFVFHPSFDLCSELLEKLGEYEPLLIACIVYSYNYLFYEYRFDHKEVYYYYACKANNTEIMESEYRPGYKKGLCFDYSTYIIG